MHQAFYPIRLIRGTHYDFECITCFQNYLLIGTKSGQLLIYEITSSVSNHPDVFIPMILGQDQSAPHKPLEFTLPVDSPTNQAFPALPSLNVRLCATHNLCKKRVLQLQAIPEYGFFLALTEFQLTAHNLSNRQLIAVVPNNLLNRFKKPLVYTDEIRSPSNGYPRRLNLCICCQRITTSAKVATTLMSPLPYCMDPVTFDEIVLPKTASTNTTSDEPDVDSTKENCGDKWVVGASAPFIFASDESFFTLMPDDTDVKSTPTFTWSDIAQCIQVFPPFLLAVIIKEFHP
ncbi:hypothetical protein EGR_08412 [Echinococcus granulosus]|uniref:CNH domain-containing protein n=1 Tax=Echinococcus granulosus TaxID=6210 RepID=W6UTE4_ECHGR|nr:hypothetical protein EGR_08412 [Echinococcus granulosus]EUB56684.1 hypothetical protein EGR_08412 [Echinococcus granulosus]